MATTWRCCSSRVRPRFPARRGWDRSLATTDRCLRYIAPEELAAEAHAQVGRRAGAVAADAGLAAGL
jgi:hypothetical protein